MSKTALPVPAGHPARARLLAAAAAALVLGAAATVPARAIDNGGPLDQAIAAGTIGEQADGYLGFVQPATAAQRDLERRVREVNLGRRSVYADVATRNGETQDRVAVLQAVRQITNTEAGTYFKDLSGTWCRRGPANRVGFATDGTIQIQCR
jgi:hypothetical protein